MRPYWCRNCKIKFSPNSGSQTFCSLACRKEYDWVHNHGKIKNCVACGAEFISRHKRITCSPDCHDQHLQMMTERWRKGNVERRQETRRKWVAANREHLRNHNRQPHILERRRIYARKKYYANPELMRERSNRWAKKHPEQVRERRRLYRQKNWAKLYADAKRWRAANKDRAREHGRRSYWNNRDKRLQSIKTPEYKLARRLREKSERYREWRKRYNETHREQLRKKSHRLYWANRERILARDRQRKLKLKATHPELVREQLQRYYAQHRDRRREEARKVNIEKRAIIKAYRKLTGAPIKTSDWNNIVAIKRALAQQLGELP